MTLQLLAESEQFFLEFPSWNPEVKILNDKRVQTETRYILGI